MNKVNLIGRLTADPEVRYTQGDQPICIASYRLAVERRGKKVEGQQNADFISIKAFGKGGEFAEKYLHKGMKVAVSGHIQTGSYTRQDGQNVYTTDVIADEQEFCESKAANDVAQNTAPKETQKEKPPIDDFMSIPNGIDEELPFN
ncbi:single-stranded DNA-binding protein [Bacillota bacterium HCP3S3_E9]